MKKHLKLIISFLIIILLGMGSFNYSNAAKKGDYMSTESDNQESKIFDGEYKWNISKTEDGKDYSKNSSFYSATSLSEYAGRNPNNFIYTPAKFIIGRTLGLVSFDSGTPVGGIEKGFQWSHCIDHLHDGRLGHYKVLGIIDIDVGDKPESTVYKATKTASGTTTGFDVYTKLKGASKKYAKQLAYMLYKNTEWKYSGSGNQWSVYVANLYGNIYHKNKSSFHSVLVYPSADTDNDTWDKAKESLNYAKNGTAGVIKKKLKDNREEDDPEPKATYKKSGVNKYVILGPFKIDYDGGDISLTKVVVRDEEAGTKGTKKPGNKDAWICKKNGKVKETSPAIKTKTFYVKVKVSFAEKNLNRKTFTVYIKQKGSSGLYSARMMLMSNTNTDYIAQNISIGAAVEKPSSHSLELKIGTPPKKGELKVVKYGEKDVMDTTVDTDAGTDADTDAEINPDDIYEKIGGAVFNVYKDGVYYTQVTTINDTSKPEEYGTYTLTDLEEGDYYAVEVSLPNEGNYYFNAQSEEDKTTDTVHVDPDSDEIISISTVNIKYTNLKILKKVKDSKTPIEGVTFRIQYYDTQFGRWRWVDNTYSYSGSGPATFNLTDDISKAYSPITPASGEIYLNNVPCGDYRVQEALIPEDLPYSYDPEWNDDDNGDITDTKIPHMSPKITCKPINASNCNDYNERTFTCQNPWHIKISGYVYNPDRGNKEYESVFSRDGGTNYNADNDRVVSNVKVTLLKDGKTYVFNADGKNGEISCETTDENGYYEYTIQIGSEAELSSFSVQFTYDGLDFIAAEPNYDDPNISESGLKTGNTSKAKESTENRTKTDNAYEEIKGVKAPVDPIEKNEGYAVEMKSEGTAKETLLKYDFHKNEGEGEGTTGTSISTVKDMTLGYKVDGKKILINDGTIKSENIVNATYNLNGQGTTDPTLYNYTNYDIRTTATTSNPNGILTKVVQLNLGIIRREQPNIEVSNSIYNVKATINGFENMYEIYGRTLEDRRDDDINMGVTFVDEGELDDFPVYASDVQTIADNKDGHLELFVTYKTTIRNSSSELYVKVNELAIFYDPNYELQSIKNSSGEEITSSTTSTRRSVGLQEKKPSDKIIQYNTAYLDLSSLNPEPQNEEIIYATYKIKDEELVNMLLDNKYTPQFKNIVEVNSYSAYEDKERTKLYVGIDPDSAPGNIPKEIDTSLIQEDIREKVDESNDDAGEKINKEIKANRRKQMRAMFDNDTGYADEFTLYFGALRNIEGTVFLDESTVNSILERTSNGKLDESDNKLGNVEVSIREVELNEDGTAVVDSSTGEIKEKSNPMQDTEGAKKWLTAKCITKEDGTYRIRGFVPGNYVLVYKYNNETYYKDLDGNNININALDYKSAVITKDNVDYHGGINETTGKDYTANGNLKWHMNDNLKITDNGRYTDEEMKIELAKFDRYTEAIDNWVRRKKIDYELIDFNSVKFEDSGEISDKGTMDAYTPAFKINIELNTLSSENKFLPEGYMIYNMDFGITQRAKQDIEMEQKISNVKITLANGQVLIDGDPSNPETLKNMSGVKYMPRGESFKGLVDIELDNELIHGSTLEITYNTVVKNIGERDYYNETYYKYGLYGNDKSEEVEMINPQIYNYVDNKLTVDMEKGNNSDWEVIPTNKFEADAEGENKIIVHKDALENINNYNTVALYKPEFTLKAGEEKEMDLILSRVLSNTDEELTYNNDAEMIKGVKNRGRRINRVKQLGTEKVTDKSMIKTISVAAAAEETTITPPTGQNRNYTVYIIIGLSSLIILAVGIIIIKKKVIK